MHTYSGTRPSYLQLLKAVSDTKLLQVVRCSPHFGWDIVTEARTKSRIQISCHIRLSTSVLQQPPPPSFLVTLENLIFCFMKQLVVENSLTRRIVLTPEVYHTFLRNLSPNIQKMLWVEVDRINVTLLRGAVCQKKKKKLRIWCFYSVKHDETWTSSSRLCQRI